MGRIAGNSGSYQLALVDSKGKAHGVSVALPSVTTILKALPKDGLDWWGYKLGLEAALALPILPKDLEDLYALAKKTGPTPRTALTSAGNRGTDVHDVAEKLLKGTLTVAQLDQSNGYLRALADWYATVKGYEVIAVEVCVFSLDHRYSGTFDYVLRDPLDGTYVLGDFKTSKAVYESHKIQIAAYAHAAREIGLIPATAPVRREVIRLGVDGQFERVLSSNTIADFLAVMAVWKLLYGGNK